MVCVKMAYKLNFRNDDVIQFAMSDLKGAVKIHRCNKTKPGLGAQVSAVIVGWEDPTRLPW